MAIRVKSGQDWTFDEIDEMFHHIQRIAKDKYKLKTYPNQIEIITSEQMLDAYSAVGLPILFPHWSYGEQFVKELEAYKRGFMGLAYEIVINSSPCIAYLMEENTMLMQTLVIAHACFGHNHFFANNYLFKQWTDAESIITYLMFAKKYIRQCEEMYGIDEVEKILDVCIALQHHGVDKYKKPKRLSVAQEEQLKDEREEYRQSQLNEVWRSIPNFNNNKAVAEAVEKFPKHPEENILYFIEKNAPRLKEWQREIIRIVRKISQYFYPQMQTQVMNEGCATYFHYRIVNDLYDEGLIDDGAMQEFLTTHTNVVLQRDDGPFNPYALGFAMYKDIERIAMDPTPEDRAWFGNQKWVGCGDWLGTIHWAIENFKDESFITQFLSPKIIRDFKMYSIHDDDRDPMYEVSGIHNDQGYKTVRTNLAQQYNIGYKMPDIQVYNVDRWGDRTMTLRHYMVNRRPLDTESAGQTIKYLSSLWGYPITLESVDPEGQVKASWKESNDNTMLDIFLDDDK